MNKYIYMILVTCAMGFAACSSDDHDSSKPTDWPKEPGTSGITKTYGLGEKLQDYDTELVWSDEFNEGTTPNEAYWTHELDDVRNDEVQGYTARPENCRIEGGNLVITGRKEETPYVGTNGKVFNATSASIITNKKKSWEYGRFEIRAKVPSGTTGIWPAFWAKGDSQNSGKGWPQCGEIDIMEYAAKNPNQMIQNVIWGKGSAKEDRTNIVKYVESQEPYHADFHVYALNWSDKQLTFAIDGVVTQVVNMSDIAAKGFDNPFKGQKFSLLLNLALGTPEDGSLGGKFDESTLPVQFIVDYVRVYQTVKDETTTN